MLKKPWHRARELRYRHGGALTQIAAAAASADSTTLPTAPPARISQPIPEPPAAINDHPPMDKDTIANYFEQGGYERAIETAGIDVKVPSTWKEAKKRCKIFQRASMCTNLCLRANRQ